MILGIAGRMEAGKSSLARSLCSHLDNTTIIPLAGAVRFEVKLALDDKEFPPSTPDKVLEAFEHLSRMSPVSRREAVYGKPTHPDARLLLQWWGTDYRRAQEENYWIDQHETHFGDFYKDPINIGIVDDVRFINEANYIREVGGLTLWLERTTPNDRSHKSEHGMEPTDCDFVVDSNCELSQMIATATRIVDGIVKGHISAS